jgi:predicted alpha/beta hydrolase family esterase
MKTLLILHGIGGYAGFHWQKWLHDELVKKGYQVLMPSLPEADHPDRGNWLRVCEKLVRDVDFSNLTIVGHSLGVVTALDLILSEKRKIKGLVSVSGFFRDYGAELNSYFLKEKEIDLSKVKEFVGSVVVFYGDDDPYVPQNVLKELAVGLDVGPIVINKGGHLNTDSGYTNFPDLLRNILEI